MNKIKNKSILFVAALVVVSVIFISFNDDDDFKLAKNMEIFYDLMRDLDRYYVDKIDVEKNITAGIQDMLKSLDPYTVYYPESQIEDYRLLTTGQYGGIGALMRQDSNQIVIEEINENYPADKAGLKIGDIIISVEGKPANAKTYQDISELMKGLPDTELEICILRPSENKRYTKRLVRERIVSKSVDYTGLLSKNIGYIKLSEFSPNAYEEVKSAILKLKSQNADKFILDLRNNPGGLLHEAVKMVSIFVKQGTLVVKTKGKMKQWNATYKTSTSPIDLTMPVVVLVNRNSASASEIVSGALQDLDRAVIMGERTFGKGLVQTTLDLSYNAKMKITTAKYYIPSGRCIQALDYSHRNPDGSVGHIPDSLISEFETVSGRKVYDGGGIMPDMKIEEKNFSSITRYLYNNMIIFDFATDYAFKHSTIDSANNFSISNADFDKFVKFAASKDISYKTDTEKQLDSLIQVSKNEGYYKTIKTQLAQLQSNLHHSAEEDIIYFQKEIKKLLNAEIVRRYYYRRGVAINRLNNDELIDQAINVLTDKNRYNKILNIVSN